MSHAGTPASEVKPVCCQLGCGKESVARATWPGRDEMTLCEDHARKAKGTADVLGFHLQVVRL